MPISEKWPRPVKHPDMPPITPEVKAWLSWRGKLGRKYGPSREKMKEIARKTAAKKWLIRRKKFGEIGRGRFRKAKQHMRSHLWDPEASIGRDNLMAGS